MPRSQPSRFLANAVVKRGGAPAEQPSSCLACGGRIDSGEPTIKIRGALIHMRCAAYRRRLARR
jgi:hypothetical protein